MAPGRGPKAAMGGPTGPLAGTVDLKELPIYAHREHILQHVRDNRITHIQGETGCGKSTQVPKYIMEDAAEHKLDTKIIVTQPRRMAAITLARRVASELGEDLGKTVGYKISGDSVGGKLCFVTTGFLLQVLVNQPEEFSTYTHVILDEVHERSVDADLLSMLMKLLLQCSPHVKLIVMSATLQARLFADYFACVEVPQGIRQTGGRQGRLKAPEASKPIFVGVRTFPVEEIFLDEIDQHFSIKGGFARMGLDKALNGFWNMDGGGKGKGGKGGKGKGKEGGKASGFKRLEPEIAKGFDELCKELVQQMAREKCTLIVFLPGIADITSFYEALAPLDASRGDRRSAIESWKDDDEGPNGSGSAGPSGGEVQLRIYPMHSLIPREEQEEVFNPPKAGVCHVVLASNIAESSLTLPSVCGIIDLAMRRSIQYDARRLMSCLVTTWCSQSSCKQRAGRAGRTMPGRAVRFVTRSFHEKHMVEFDPPEMLNAPLTKLYLQAKQLTQKLDNMWNNGLIPEGIDMDLSTPTLLLGEVVQPPATALVEAAITELADVGCIDRATEDALITPLGYIAMALPCELRLCRLLYFGLMLQMPCDAIAIVAGLTAADPFSTPSLLVLKDQGEYSRKLERSFGSRVWFDQGRHSEPLMLRDLFATWIEAGAPRGPKAMGSFARDHNVIPKKFEALACEAMDLCTRMLKLLGPRSAGHTAIQRLMSTMRFNVDKRDELVKVNYPENHEYKKIFSDDVGLLRALICGGFSDQILVHLKPKWAPSGGKKKKEEVIIDTMKKQGLDYAGTVCILNPPSELRAWEPEENHQKLCEAMCGERAKRVHWDEKEKLLYYDFIGPKQQQRRGKFRESPAPTQAIQGWEDGDPQYVIQDVCPQAHRLHQFGAGRWKFNVELPMDLYNWGAGENASDIGQGRSSVEILKPIQPFLLTWEVIQHSAAAGGGKSFGKGGPKKPSVVKAMPDWRNPVGFACHTAGTLPPQEHLGVCASVQGLESGASAFVAGATILGLNHLPLLLTTLDPNKFNMQWGFDPKTGEVRAVKIMHYEIFLPEDTLTADVLWKVNRVREVLLESLTPWEEPREQDDHGGKGGGGHRRGPHGGYIWVSDITREMSALLEEIWPQPGEVVKPKKVLWSTAAGEPVSDQHLGMQPIAEEMSYHTVASTFAQPALRPGGGQQQGGAEIKAKKGVTEKEAKAVREAVAWLSKQPTHEATLSSICGRFRTSPKAIGKFPDFLKLSPIQGKNDEIVRLAADASGGSGKGRKGNAGGAGGGAAAKKAPAPAKKEQPSGGAQIDGRIEKLCKTPQVGCQPADFDTRVRKWIRGFAQRRGQPNCDEAFNMLGEWCARKERDQVRSWPSYLLVLMRNWEKETFEGGHDEDQ